jgi:glutamate dehydrogenase
MARRQAPALLDEQARFIRFLEKSGRLDRVVEYLPSDEEIVERKARGLGLTAPEQAVLLAYSKMWLSDAFIDSTLPEDPWVATALQRYFPALLRERFGHWIPRHPLAREIIATHVVNSTVNRVGATFVHRLGELSGAAPDRTLRAYLATREVFGLVPTWQAIEALDAQVPEPVQAAMVLTLGELIATATGWFLRSRRLDQPMEPLVALFRPAVEALQPSLEQQDTVGARAAEWIGQGVPELLARRVAAAPGALAALDIAEIAAATGRPLELTAQVHWAVNGRLGLDRLRRLVALLPSETYWQSLARVALADDLADLQRAMTQQALQSEPGSAEAVLAAWESLNQPALERTSRLLAELGETAAGDLAALSVALRELRNLL